MSSNASTSSYKRTLYGFVAPKRTVKKSPSTSTRVYTSTASSSPKVFTSSSSPANTNTIGFDPTAVRMSLNRLQNTYNDMLSSFINYTNTFLNNMGYVWACPEAVTFFRNIFCPEFNSFVTRIDTSISNIFDAINNSARSWSDISKLSYGKVNFVRFQHKSFDASSIRESINGNVGIDPVSATSNLSTLDKISSMLNTSLTNMVNILRTTSFVGKGQQEVLIQSVNSIKNNINNKYEAIIIGIKNQINNTSQKYKNIATSVSTSFSSIK